MTATGHADALPEKGLRRWLAAFLAVPVLLALAIIAVTVALLAGAATDDAAATAPLDLAAVSEPIAGHYHAAEALADTYQQVPCYCGCEQFLAHRDLSDCFVRADGAGWESHAAGCGVCIAESTLVRDLTDTGLGPAAIAEAVIDHFGTTPTTAPPT